MDLFYRPPNAYVGDVIPYYDEADGLFKPFYLKKWRDYDGADRVEGWHMLTTADHLHFTERPTGVIGGTGCILRVEGVYHMFYCKFERQYRPVKQWVHHAVSLDGMRTWKELLDEAFQADDVIYEITDLRDPFVFWHEEERCYWMLIAAQRKGKTMRKGCVGLLKSTDLAHWRFCQPFYAPATNTSALECPDLFRMGEWYYLIYSSYTDRFQTVYRMSRSLSGPWIAPETDTFDTRAFYAAKTASDGHTRYLYAWNPTRNDNMWKFNPETYMGDDYNTWDWGGHMVIHQLSQKPDGTLTVRPVEAVRAALPKEVPPVLTPLNGAWRTTERSAAADTPYGFSSLLLNEIPPLCRLEMDVVFDAPLRQLGLALQVNEDFDMGYYLTLEPYRGRVQFKTGIRLFEDGGKMFPYEVEMERPLALEPGKPVHVEVLVQGSILVAYFNHETALSTRMFNYQNRRFGLFASDGEARFDNIRMFVP